MNNIQEIKMMAYNPKTRKTEEVFPEDEVTIAEMFPVFLSAGETYVTVPGYEASWVYDEWTKALKS